MLSILSGARLRLVGEWQWVLANSWSLRIASSYSVSARQVRLALLEAGLLAAVEAAVKSAGGATQITWEYATEIRRDDALITTIGTSLGLTDAAIDLLLKKASLII